MQNVSRNSAKNTRTVRPVRFSAVDAGSVTFPLTGILYHEINKVLSLFGRGDRQKGDSMKKQTQADKVLKYLKTHKELTRADGFTKLHVLNLPEVIRVLRKQGHQINTYEYQKDGSHWCAYSLR